MTPHKTVRECNACAHQKRDENNVSVCTRPGMATDPKLAACQWQRGSGWPMDCGPEAYFWSPRP